MLSGPFSLWPDHGPELPVSLEEVALVTPATARLQERVVRGFEGWLSFALSEPALESLSHCATAYCALLRAYGDFLFQKGRPMCVFCNLLAYMQKNRMELRPCLPMAWDLLIRRERVRGDLQRSHLHRG